MKMNNKGFTLIELLAVVVILAVIMTLAIPNIVSTINKNKKEALIEDAKKFQASAEYKLVSDTKIQKPNTNSALVLTLGEVEKAEIVTSPYGTKYSPTKSFVVITKDGKTINVNDGTGNKQRSVNEYVYYVQLVACTNDNCVDDDVDQRYGINLQRVDTLIDSERFDAVVQSDELNVIAVDDGNFANYVTEQITVSKTLIIPSKNN